MKVRRELSGIYFRSKNEETGRYENVVFEDLETEKQDEILNSKSPEWVKNLAKMLADTLNDIGSHFDITREEKA